MLRSDTDSTGIIEDNLEIESGDSYTAVSIFFSFGGGGGFLDLTQ